MSFKTLIIQLFIAFRLPDSIQQRYLVAIPTAILQLFYKQYSTFSSYLFTAFLSFSPSVLSPAQ